MNSLHSGNFRFWVDGLVCDVTRQSWAVKAVSNTVLLPKEVKSRVRYLQTSMWFLSPPPTFLASLHIPLKTRLCIYNGMDGDPVQESKTTTVSKFRWIPLFCQFILFLLPGNRKNCETVDHCLWGNAFASVLQWVYILYAKKCFIFKLWCDATDCFLCVFLFVCS